MELEQKIETYLRTNSWPGDGRYNPVVVEKGVTYVRHNAIRIGNALDANGGVSVQFLWHGMIVGWVRVEAAKLEGIFHRTVELPEGRHIVTPK